MKNSKHKHQGFTVVELLIATAVFGVVLLIASVALIQVGKTYFKGINTSATQDATRSIMDEVSQSIQFGGGNSIQTFLSATPKKYFCTKEKRYVYVTGIKLTNNPANHVFMSDNQGLGASTPCPDPNTSGWPDTTPPNNNQAVELLKPGMRLAKFNLMQDSTGLYNIDIRVAFGDDDLLCTPEQLNCSNNTATDFTQNLSNLKCKGQSGSQFCGISELSTSVQKRL